MAFLTLPSEQYKDSYLEALREFHAEGRNLQINEAEVAKDFAAFVRDELNRNDPAHVKPGRVPDTIYWLIDNGEFIGRASMRHELNDWLYHYGGHIGYEIRPSKRQLGYGKQILKLVLVKARAIGLRRVLITCNNTNIASRKIIEANGGQFENELTPESDGIPKQRYWIDLD